MCILSLPHALKQLPVIKRPELATTYWVSSLAPCLFNLTRSIGGLLSYFYFPKGSICGLLCFKKKKKKKKEKKKKTKSQLPLAYYLHSSLCPRKPKLAFLFFLALLKLLLYHCTPLPTTDGETEDADARE